MANRSPGSINVSEARETMDRLKMEVTSELGMPLTNGYNGGLTSVRNDSADGYMTEKMIGTQERQVTGK